MPCAIWPDVAPSGVTDASDTNSVELGVQFKATQNGTVSGVRFYKLSDNTGTHTGTLWSATGTELATGTFSNESTQGWEELDFSTPVTITGGTTYVASYHTSADHYSDTSGGLSSAVTKRAADRAGQRRGLRLRLVDHVPVQQLQRIELLGRRGVHARRAAPSVTSAAPVAGSSSNPVSVDPSVTFSDRGRPGAPSFTVKDGSGNTVAGDGVAQQRRHG